MNINPLMEQLHDIEGLDRISPWPLAIGWWVLITLGTFLLIGAIWLLILRIRYIRSWKRETLITLDHLEQNLSPSTSRDTVALLSEYLRRIAMHRFPRKECAGLVGTAWLTWLQAHDPQQFDWTDKGCLLLEAPYAPETLELPAAQVKELIQAIRPWVC